jgi:predicted polyphosphate/ATP-dependent NAD kinase
LAHGARPSISRRKLGLIVNPVAGLGGRVGLKGSDGAETQRRALQLGAVPESVRRATLALERLKPLANLQTFVYPGEMGADAAAACGLDVVTVGCITPGETTADDTRRAAAEMLDLGVGLLLFAGGDGTARDICAAIGQAAPALGIPSGVKMHSAVFGHNPRGAGDLAATFFQRASTPLRDAEVMDVDEDAFRRGIVAAKLYGHLRVPYDRGLVQRRKAPSVPGEEASLAAIASDCVEAMEDGVLYIIGPGTTTRAIMCELGLDKTLLGVDVVLNRQLAAVDANESRLLELLSEHPAKIIVSPIGGQGYILGRGNQQLSPRVLRLAGRGNLIVISTPDKIHALRGEPLLVDTGDPDLDLSLCGHTRVVTGYGEQIVYRVSC